ncbi:hypothetical protein QUB08_28775 [Microcoleus sp. BR0-C5]|uniref:hypothetical protein n=1 Tax=Microcoleus sp. BR0-C5 TaxID=2818713 RepID=UPI002FCEBED6
MSNPNGNIQTLKPYESKWRSGKTQTIRVPVALAEQILVVARQMDAGKSLVTQDESSSSLRILKAKIEAKEPGYRANSASKLISVLKLILDKL